MYGTPALPPDFVSLPYANPDAPKGGRVVFGNTGGFDSLNPFVQKGTAPWQLGFWGYESLMGRSWDEPFTLYGVLAESVRTAPDRSWVEFDLRAEARFSDGSPVTVEDVIWSYQTLGSQGHLRYRGMASQISDIRQTGPRTVRLEFNTDNRELALIAGMRPVLKKAQWQGKDFTASGLDEIPIGTGAYVVSDFEASRHVTLRRNPDYWGKDLPFRRGTQNFDEMRIEFYGDQTVLFEAFKAGELNVIREFNAEKWDRQYGFPAVLRGDIVKTEIPHRRPSGMTGFVMNTRRTPFDDWRVREAMLLAFNFEFINDTITGGVQPRITSYFSNSDLAMRSGPVDDKVRKLLTPYSDSLLPGALDGYSLPVSDGTARNRGNLRQAMGLLNQAGWRVSDGVLRNEQGRIFAFDVLLRQGDTGNQTVIELYARALERLGIAVSVSTVDDAQYTARISAQDFDMTTFRRDLSLSPGNEQHLYWGSSRADTPGTRNLMGVASPAVDGMIDAMLQAGTREDFATAVRALDRVLTTGRYVIPIWQFDVGRIAHIRELRYPARLPIYGDGIGFLPDVWWYQAE
ncbi:peptide/nickel transport system substrate-binding protein [Sedimentitalea nanhaiensis]|uniref:Peptide/nickel transport system substrate-binding protein n=2 Tax=Sedimentitalea nanhaiensis TaxID=999627 RepID=A0A1I6YIX0_9RHOB|nr:extracellular solute-binding protein [Sedimentitalea nanhaiensis]SFT50469.1 peptide/nickel transport system substrate-binding protein [Sedimentitalea nanhaiensis]